MEDQRAAVAGDPVRRRERWVGFAFLMTGMFLVVADQTVTVVVIPDVVDDLGVDVAAGTLLVTLYLVVAASSMVLMGRVADIVGRRRVVVIALVVFALASVLCGLAPSYEVLLAGRIVQGWTLGAYVPASLGMLNVVFPPGDADRVRASRPGRSWAACSRPRRAGAGRSW
jgi:MFS family permease